MSGVFNVQGDRTAKQYLARDFTSWSPLSGTQKTQAPLFPGGQAPTYDSATFSIIDKNTNDVVFNGPGEGFTLPPGRWNVIITVSTNTASRVDLAMYWSEQGVQLTTDTTAVVTSTMPIGNGVFGMLQYTYESLYPRTHYVIDFFSSLPASVQAYYRFCELP